MESPPIMAPKKTKIWAKLHVKKVIKSPPILAPKKAKHFGKHKIFKLMYT